MLRRALKWVAVTFLILVVSSIVLPIFAPAWSPGLLGNTLWYRLTGSATSARRLAYTAKARNQNALHKGCGTGREGASAAFRALYSFAEGNSDSLLELLDDPDAEVRGTIALAIAGAKNGWYRPALEKLVLGDPDRRVRVYACYALKEIGDKRSEPIYRAVAKSPYYEVRSVALWGLSKISKDKAVVVRLRELEQMDLADTPRNSVMLPGPWPDESEELLDRRHGIELARRALTELERPFGRKLMQQYCKKRASL